ncbi:hypothetical protein [Deinococcus malanensis]|uniref:hypothetical protein n=1 Tax=Deinococcus malanensis TaxID=1706855 RepID=UPI001E517D78|nr:hypothetical protein [Deinococcus malanensis]
MPLLHSEIATTHSGPQPTAGYLLKVTNTSTQALTVGAAWLVADDAPRSSPTCRSPCSPARMPSSSYPPVS